MNDTQASPPRGPRYRFGVFEFDPEALELRKDGRLVRVRPQSLRLLTVLVAKAGDVVSREDIQAALWGQDTFVDFEQGVNHAIRELRSALNDSAEAPRFIQTLARRGYRFVAPVERATPDGAPRPEPSPLPPSATTIAAGSARRWFTAAGLTIALAATAILASVAWWSRHGKADSDQQPTIAVVRFTSPDSEPALGAQLALAIATRLGGQQRALVRWVPSAAASSSGLRRWSEADLGAGTLVLSGDVFRQGEDVGVTARLENVSTSQVVWTQRLQLRANELHNLENVIAERVVSALDLRMAAAEQARLRRRYTDNAAAYEDYLRGRAQLVRYTPQGALAAIDAFESALRRDSGYALARAGLAMACADMCLRFAASGDVERWGQRAEAEARTALALDADLAEAHLARAAVARKREFDWGGTIASARRALVLNPNLDQAHYFIAAAFYHTGYMEEAAIEVQNGQRLRGQDATEPVRIQGIIALWSGHFAPARVHLEEVHRQSDQAIGDTYLALAYYYSGSVEQALELLRSLAKSGSASTASRAGAVLASVLANRQQSADAREQLNAVLARAYRDHHVAYNIGTAYAQLGNAADAIAWLKTAADTGFPCLVWLERDPLLDPLRSDGRFAEVLNYVRGRREAVLK